MEETVLVLASTFPRWKNDSTPGFVFELSRRLAKKNRKIIVLAPHANKASRTEKINNLEVHRFQYFKPSSLQKIAYGAGIIPNIKGSFLAKAQIPFFLASEFLAANRLIKKYKPGLLHAHWLIPQGIFGALLKKRYNIPLIATVHGSDLFPLKNPIFKYFQKMVLNECYICTVNSIATKKEIISRFPEFSKKIAVIPMGVDIELFRRAKAFKKNQDKKTVLFIGRLNEQKGIEYLIKSISIVKNKFSNIKLLIIGEGSYKSKLTDIVDYSGVQDNVEFLGAKSHNELINYYNQADVFVLPSVTSKIGTEGLGIVLLEAMAAKVPVIGANTGGIKYIIKDNQTGILVKEKNEKEIADAIRLLLSNKKLADKLRKSAFKFVTENYSWDKIAAKFDNLYNKIK